MVVVFLIRPHLSRPTSSKTLLHLSKWLRGRDHHFEGPLENEYLLPVLPLSLCSLSARQSFLASQSIKQELRSSSHPYKIIGTYNSVSFPSFLHSQEGFNPAEPQSDASLDIREGDSALQVKPDEVILSRTFFLKLLSLIDQQELYQTTQQYSRRVVALQKEARGRGGERVRCRAGGRGEGGERPEEKEQSAIKSFRSEAAGKCEEGGERDTKEAERGF